MNFFRKAIRLAAGLMFLAGAGRAAGDGPPASKPETRKEIVAVIEAQLAAFRAGDVRQAYHYAAAELQAQKPLKVFTSIVRTNYPEIWASTRAEYGIVRDDGTTATLAVQVFGKAGGASYDYTLVKERAGWRIHAVLRHEPKQRDQM